VLSLLQLLLLLLPYNFSFSRVRRAVRQEGRKTGASEQILGIRMRRGQLPLKRLKESTYLLMTPSGPLHTLPMHQPLSEATPGTSSSLITLATRPQRRLLGTYYLTSVRYCTALHCTAMQSKTKPTQRRQQAATKTNKSNDGTKGKPRICHTHHGFCDVSTLQGPARA
jgi:hypothetical protein